MSVDAEQVARIVVRALEKKQPIDGLWSLASIAQWCEISERKARELVNTPGFPRAIRLPTDGNGVGHPRWIAQEVVRWLESRRD